MKNTIVDLSEFQLDDWTLCDDDELSIVLFGGDPDEGEITREDLEQNLNERGMEQIFNQLKSSIEYQKNEYLFQMEATIKLDKETLMDQLPLVSQLYKLSESPEIHYADHFQAGDGYSIPLIEEGSYGSVHNIDVNYNIYENRLEISYPKQESVLDDLSSVAELLVNNGYGVNETFITKTIESGDLDGYGCSELYINL